jgi:hypothetical protein
MPFVAEGFNILVEDLVNDTTYVLSGDNVHPHMTGRLDEFQVLIHPLGLLVASA